jgi:CubicO group peptidase (beta-lactamase class C family)
MLTALALTACLFAPPASPSAAADLPAQIDAAVQQAGQGKFWGAVLVAKDGTELFFKGYGAADYAKAPITRDTIFELASVSKQVAGAAIIRLLQDKKLKLSDPLHRFFPKCPADKRDVTVRQMLNHTSGIHNERTLPYASPATRADFVKFFLDAPVVSKPGEQWAYNNGGYALLAAIVEVASGTTFEKYCHAKLFKPAKLKRTGFINEKAMQRGSVTVRLGDGGAQGTASDWHYGWGYRGMGGVVSTAADLLAWDRALRGTKVFKAPAKAELYTPSLNNYAGGWFVETTLTGNRRAQHSGSVAGYQNHVVRHLEDDLVIIVLSNGKSSTHAVTAAIERLLLKAPPMTAAIHWRKLTLNRNQGMELGETAAWSVAKAGANVTMSLRRGKEVLATLTLPPGAARKLAADLAAARAQQPATEAKGVTSAIYLANWRLGGADPMVVEQGLRFRILPRFQGRGGEVDERVWMTLVEEGGIAHQRWPLMSRFDHAGCDALVTALRAAATAAVAAAAADPAGAVGMLQAAARSAARAVLRFVHGDGAPAAGAHRHAGADRAEPDAPGGAVPPVSPSALLDQ